MLDHNIATSGFKISSDFSLGLREQNDANKLMKSGRSFEDPKAGGDNQDKKKKNMLVSQQPNSMFADKEFQ